MVIQAVMQTNTGMAFYILLSRINEAAAAELYTSNKNTGCFISICHFMTTCFIKLSTNVQNASLWLHDTHQNGVPFLVKLEQA